MDLNTGQSEEKEYVEDLFFEYVLSFVYIYMENFADPALLSFY